MNEELDRLLEERLCALIGAETQGIQCVPFQQGVADAPAVLPRIAIKAESADTPELYTVAVFNVQISAMAFVRADDPECQGQLGVIKAAVNKIFNACDLVAKLNTARIQAYGAVPGGKAQDIETANFAWSRTLMVPARVR